MATTNPSAYAGLFTTPQELQAKQLDALRNRQAAIANMGGSYDALLGQIAAGGGTTGAMLAQGIKGMFGLKSNEEIQAQKMQDILAQNKGDVAGLRAAAEQLMQSGDMKNAYALQMLAKDMAETTGVDILDTNDNKNIMFIAKNELQCDIKDPKCLAQARDIYIKTKRADTASDQMNVQGYKGLDDKYKQAETSRSNILVANDSLRLLDSGKVNLGAFAKTRQGAEKMYTQVLQSLGFAVESEADAVARTAQLMAQTKRLAGQLLQSGMFGAGTGISERDLQTAMEMAGSAETLTPQAMKQILEYNAKFEQVKLQKYNDSLNRYSDAFWMRTPEGSADAFYVNIPEVYKATNIRDMDTKELTFGDKKYTVPNATTAVGEINGTVVYQMNGKYYTMDGKEFTLDGK